MSLLQTYHRVDTLLWLDIAAMLEAIARARVENGTQVVSVCLADAQVESIIQFINQMQVGYLHPNSAAIRYTLKRSGATLVRSSVMQISCQCKSVRSKKNFSLIPCENKPKQFRKEVAL